MQFLKEKCFLDPIVSIEPLGVEETYNITVKDTQSFIANKFVVHNTVMLNPTIQTVPQRGEFAHLIKDVYVADDGWSFGARDLAQSELRIMGWLSGCSAILQALKDGIDLHTATAASVAEVPISEVTKQMRQDSKGINFG